MVGTSHHKPPLDKPLMPISLLHKSAEIEVKD